MLQAPNPKLKHTIDRLRPRAIYPIFCLWQIFLVARSVLLTSQACVSPKSSPLESVKEHQSFEHELKVLARETTPTAMVACTRPYSTPRPARDSCLLED
jgi:hypothetical protein